MEEIERIQNEINALNQTKGILDNEINQKNATITQLDTDILSRTTTRDNFNSQITVLTALKSDIEAQINVNTTTRNDLDQVSAVLSANNETYIEDIKKLEDKKRKLEDNVKLLREKSDLFSNDIAGIGEDSKGQRIKYTVGISLSFFTAVIFMCILVNSIKGEISFPESMKTSLTGNPRLLFAMFALIRISVVGSLFILIFVFINLTRGFVSQYIRTQEKMTTIRLLDYLVSKIGKESSNIPETERILFETKKLEKQNDLLNKHLPGLIEYNPSSFEKLSKTKSPDERLTELVMNGKIIIPKTDG
jgi:hypothetical protein